MIDDALDEPTVQPVIPPLPIRDGPRGGASHYILACHGCGHTFRMAARTLRGLRAERRAPLCEMCRRPSSIEVTDRDREFWRQRFSQAEINWMAESFFGPRVSTPTAIAASARR